MPDKKKKETKHPLTEIVKTMKKRNEQIEFLRGYNNK